MKKFAVIALLVLCCTACIFAQGGMEAKEIDLSANITKTTSGIRIEFPKPIQKTATYDLVGYRYVFELDGDTIAFKYVDAVGSDEIPVIAQALMAIIPGAVSYTNPAAGNITIKSKYILPEANFDKFVVAAEALIYDTIY